MTFKNIKETRGKLILWAKVTPTRPQGGLRLTWKIINKNNGKINCLLMSGPKMAFLEQSRTTLRHLKTILGPRWREMIQDQPKKALLVSDTNKKNSMGF